MGEEKIDFKQLEIIRYGNWRLYLHENQFPYLGRCCASAIREGANLVTEITPAETQELFSTIIPQWNKAVSELYGKQRPNVAIFGNTTPILQAHLIPRFFDIRRFYGIDFEDPNPTGNYSPYKKIKLPLETLLEIKGDIQGKLIILNNT